MSVSFDWGGMVTVCQGTVPMSEDVRYRVPGDRSVVIQWLGVTVTFVTFICINVNFFKCSMFALFCKYWFAPAGLRS